MKKTILIFLGAFFSCGGMNPEQNPQEKTSLRFAEPDDYGTKMVTDLPSELTFRLEDTLRDICEGRIHELPPEFSIPGEYLEDVQFVFQSCAVCHRLHMEMVTPDSYDVRTDKPKEMSLTDEERLVLLKKVKEYWEHHRDARKKIESLLKMPEVKANAPELFFLLERMYFGEYPCQPDNRPRSRLFYSPLDSCKFPLIRVSTKLLGADSEEVMYGGTGKFFIDRIGKWLEGWRPDPGKTPYRWESEARDP
jgi:hypothetical protein